jgi:hypothetical protein
MTSCNYYAKKTSDEERNILANGQCGMVKMWLLDEINGLFHHYVATP